MTIISVIINEDNNKTLLNPDDLKIINIKENPKIINDNPIKTNVV